MLKGFQGKAYNQKAFYDLFRKYIHGSSQVLIFGGWGGGQENKTTQTIRITNIQPGTLIRLKLLNVIG